MKVWGLPCRALGALGVTGSLCCLLGCSSLTISPLSALLTGVEFFPPTFTLPAPCFLSQLCFRCVLPCSRPTELARGVGLLCAP